MTTTHAADPGGAVLDRTDEGRDRPSISEPLSRLLRVMQAVKQHGVAGEQARERAAHVLLFPLVQLGPQRQGALADLVHADPSTVSRHVSLLVERGLVRRVPDEHDGRVSRLVATEEGTAVLQGMRRERDALLDRVTSSWTPAELVTFADLLERFVHDVTDLFPALSVPGSPATATSGAAPRGSTTPAAADAAPSEEKNR